MQPAAVRRTRAFVIGTTALISLVVGRFLMLTYEWTGIDDEGYLVVMIREWVHRGALYDEVYSQYGPFPTLLLGLPLRLLGLDLTLTAGRYISLVLLVGASVLIGVTVLRLSNSLATAVASQVIAVASMSTIAGAPLHPVALLLFLLAATVANITLLHPIRPRISDALTGGLTAAVILTKPNVGAFLAVALVYLFASRAHSARARAWWIPLSEAALVLLGPVTLLTQWIRLERSDVRSLPILQGGGFTTDLDALVYWSIAYVAAALLVVVWARLLRSCEGASEVHYSLRDAAIGFGVIGGLTIAATLGTGTTITAFVDNLLIRPNQQPEVLLTLPRTTSAVLVWIIGLPAFGFVGWWLVKDRRSRSGWVLAASGALRVGGGVVLVITALPAMPTSLGSLPPAGRFAYLPLVALLLLPGLRSGPPRFVDGRCFLTALAVTHSLHAFPVAGVQLPASLLLAAVCGVVVVDDGARELAAALATTSGTRLAKVVAVSVPVVLLVVVVASYQDDARRWVARYRDGSDLALPDSDGVRLPSGDALGRPPLRAIVADLEGCREVVSLPGINSLYVWSEIRPPTGLNTTLWPELLNTEEQEAIMKALDRAEPPTCFVIMGSQIRPNGDLLASGPLAEYLQDNFDTARRGRGYEVRVRRDH